MRNRAIEYPHPVLNEYTQDYLNSRFSIDVLSHTDNGSEIVIEIDCHIECNGLIQAINAGDASVLMRVTCYRTSLRKIYELRPSGSSIIRIPKQDVTDSIDLQAVIVASHDISNFQLPEFNSNYFGGVEFKIRKGDVLADEPGIKIKLNTTLEKNMSGIVLVKGDLNATSMKVFYPENTEESPELSDYIVITVPDMDYKNYAKMMKKKHLKNGVDRFVQASVILPAITEAVGKLRMEETTESEDGNPISQFRGTVWADSIYAALKKYDIFDLSACAKSDYEIANILLGNVCSDSISNLMQKLSEWSTIREEDPTL